MIKNQIERNERVDPKVIILKLKQENAQLKAELALLKGGDVKDELDGGPRSKSVAKRSSNTWTPTILPLRSSSTTG